MHAGSRKAHAWVGLALLLLPPLACDDAEAVRLDPRGAAGSGAPSAGQAGEGGGSGALACAGAKSSPPCKAGGAGTSGTGGVAGKAGHGGGGGKAGEAGAAGAGGAAGWGLVEAGGMTSAGAAGSQDNGPCAVIGAVVPPSGGCPATCTCPCPGYVCGGSGIPGLCGSPPTECEGEFCLLTPPETKRHDYARVWAAAPDDAWTVGPKGRVERWTGSVWVPISIGTTQDLLDVTGAAPDDVYAVGDEGLFHFDGAAWAHVLVGAMTAVAARGDSVWAALAGGGFVRRVDGSWSYVEPEPQAYGQFEVSRIRTGGPEDLWAIKIVCGVHGPGVCGDWGPAAYHWDGSQWSSVDLGMLTYTSDVLALGEQDAWGMAVPYNLSDGKAGLFHWDGAAWTKAVDEPPGRWLRSLGGKLLVGDSLLVNGSLTPLLAPYPPGEWADLSGTSPEDVWMVGKSGKARFTCGAWQVTAGASGPRVLAGVSGSEAWGLQSPGPGQDVIHHWTGGSWVSDPAAPIFPSGSSAEMFSASGQLWVIGGGLLARRQEGVWTEIEPPASIGGYHYAVTGPDDVWYSNIEGVHRWNGQSWTLLVPGDAPVITAADASAVWIEAKTTESSGPKTTVWFWDGAELHDVTSEGFFPEAASRGLDGSLVALGGEAGADGHPWLRLRQGDGWGPWLPGEPPPSTGWSKLWARTADDVWLADHASYVLHVTSQGAEEVSLPDDAKVEAMWGDAEAVYFGTENGAIWRLAAP